MQKCSDVPDALQQKQTVTSKHYQQNGESERTQESRGKRLSSVSCQMVVEFLDKYSTQHPLQLPGRIQGSKRELLQLLPCSETKCSIYDHYRKSCELGGLSPVSKASFTNIWKDCRPYIADYKPMTDLCDVCQKQGTNIAS